MIVAKPKPYTGIPLVRLIGTSCTADESSSELCFGNERHPKTHEEGGEEEQALSIVGCTTSSHETVARQIPPACQMKTQTAREPTDRAGSGSSNMEEHIILLEPLEMKWHVSDFFSRNPRFLTEHCATLPEFSDRIIGCHDTIFLLHISGEQIDAVLRPLHESLPGAMTLILLEEKNEPGILHSAMLWTKRLPNLQIVTAPCSDVSLLTLLGQMLRRVRDQHHLKEEAQAYERQLREQIIIRRKLEAELTETARERDELQFIMDSLPAYILVAADAQGKEIVGNRAAAELLRISGPRTDQAGDPAATEISSVSFKINGVPISKHDFPLTLAAGSGQSLQNQELELLFSTGERRYLFGNVVPLLDESLAPQGSLGIFVDISSRKEVERESEWAARLFARIAEATPDILYVYDLFDHHYSYVNREITHLLGYTLEELEAMGDDAPRTIVHPDDYSRLLEVEAGYPGLADGVVLEHDCRMRHRDGRYRWFRSREVVFSRSDDGQPCQILGFAQDISRDKEAEEALRASEERYRTLAERTPQLICICDLTGNAVDFNHNWFKFTGQNTATASGRGWIETFHPDDQERALTALSEGTETSNPLRLYQRIRRGKDGPYSWFLMQSVLLHHPVGSALRWINTFTDIDYQKHTDSELEHFIEVIQDQRQEIAKSEARYKALRDAIDFGGWLADREGRMIYLSQSFLDFCNLTQEKALGFGWMQCLGDDGPATLEHWLQSVEDGASWEAEYKILGSDGKQHTVLSRGRPVKNNAGETINWVGIHLDISERKEIEHSLKEAKEQLSAHARNLERRVADRTAELQESLQSLESFCYSIAHDLRAPLRAMTSFSSLLRQECAGSLSPGAIEYATRIAQAAERMDQLILDLLAYGRLAHVDLPREWIDLDKHLTVILGSISEDIKERNAQIVTSPNPPFVWATPAILQQVLLNLITNALKFARQGIPPVVEITVQDQSWHTIISVKDNGIGIAPHHKDRIFHIFERLNAGENFPGTGIGLAIAKKGVERMGGRIGLESTMGEGSRFWFELPKPRADSIGPLPPFEEA